MLFTPFKNVNSQDIFIHIQNPEYRTELQQFRETEKPLNTISHILAAFAMPCQSFFPQLKSVCIYCIENMYIHLLTISLRSQGKGGKEPFTSSTTRKVSDCFRYRPKCLFLFPTFPNS